MQRKQWKKRRKIIGKSYTEEWKNKNPNGSKVELLRYLKVELKDDLATVERCRQTYNELIKKMPESVSHSIHFFNNMEPNMAS